MTEQQIMSIASTIKNALSPSTISPEDVDVEAALNAKHSAEQQKVSLYSKNEERRAQLSKAKRNLSDAALVAEQTGSDVDYETLKVEIEKLQAAIERTDSAIQAADEIVVDAIRKLHLAGVDRQLKTLRRNLNRRSKHLALMQAALETYALEFKKVETVNQIIISAWPSGIGGRVEPVEWPCRSTSYDRLALRHSHP
jgi:hypothetical protein